MSRQNVQLPKEERIQVYVHPDTKRILGFGPEGTTPSFPRGTRYTEILCLTAKESEGYVARYSEQCKIDAECDAQLKIERDRPAREAIRSAIRARNNHVDPRNRDLNNACLLAMDRMYEKVINSKLKQTAMLPAQSFEAGASSAKIAMDSPHFHRNIE